MSDTKIFSSRPVSFFTSNNISISFIIHVKNQFANTSLILQNIFNCKNPFEIILVNDRSASDEYFNELVSNFKSLKLIKNNGSQADAINKGVNSCESNWIFYINADFTPDNSMWLNGIINSMMNLKITNIKFVSPFIRNLSFFEVYKKEKKDVILTDRFLPFNIGFFHNDLFRTIGPLNSSDDLIEYSKNFYFSLNKRGYKQAVCMSSIFKI